MVTPAQALRLFLFRWSRRLRRLPGWLLLQLQTSLPVQAHWTASVADAPPVLSWPVASHRLDPRRGLALALLRQLRDLARQRGLQLDGAFLSLDWLDGQAHGGHLHARLTVVSPESTAHVHGLSRALQREVDRVCSACTQAHVVLHLECRHVGDAPIEGPSHFW